jgi:type VI secretion system protein ImpA
MESPPDKAVIDAAFQDTDFEELRATHEAVQAAIADVQGMESAVTERVGVGSAASLAPLVGVLKEAEKVLAGQLARRGAAQAAGPSTEPAGSAITPASSVAVVPGEIRSRQDVIGALDKICQYYERNEPSSPLPLLLRRAQRLATMSFMEILRELAPSGVAQAEAVGGLASGGSAGEPPGKGW